MAEDYIILENFSFHVTVECLCGQFVFEMSATIGTCTCSHYQISKCSFSVVYDNTLIKF